MALRAQSGDLDNLKAVVRALLMPEKQPPTLRQFLKAYRRTEGLEFPYRHFGFRDALSFLRSMPDTVQLQEGRYATDVRLMPTITQEVQHIGRLVRGQRILPDGCNRPPPRPQLATQQPMDSSRRLPPPPPQPHMTKQCTLVPRPMYPSTAAVLESMKQNIGLLLRGNQAGVDVMLLDRVYEERFGSPLNYVPFGCNTMRQFVTEMLADVVRIERDSTTDRVTLLGDGGGQFANEPEEPKEGRLSVLSDPDSVERAPQPWRSQSPMAECSAPEQQAAAGSGAANLLLSPDPVENPGSLPGHDVGALQHSPPLCTLRPPEECPIVPPVDLESPFQARDGVLLARQFSSVRITQVYNPHHFYVQCRDALDSLQWLLSDLEAVYGGWYRCKYRMDVRYLRVGMACTAPYHYRGVQTVWLRGVVYTLDVEDQGYAEVFFVDFGYASRVPKTEIHYLRNEYASVPAMAIRATLGHLKPVDGAAVWSPESTQAFVELVGENRTMLCTLLERRGTICSVHLCDTCVEPEVHIPDALVELGQADRFFVDGKSAARSNIRCAAPNAALPEEPEGERPDAWQAACMGLDDDGAHFQPLAEGARAASVTSSPSTPGRVTSFLAPLRGPASLHGSHALVGRVAAPDEPEQGLDDIEEILNALEEIPGLPAEPGDPLPGLLQSPSLQEPAQSLLPLASGDDFPGCLDALRSTLTAPEVSGARGEEPVEHGEKLPLPPRPSVHSLLEDVSRRLRALQEIPSTSSRTTEAPSPVCRQRATPPSKQATEAVPAYTEPASGRRPLGWRSSPSPPGSPLPEPVTSTGLAQWSAASPFPHTPVDFQPVARPLLLPVFQQESDTPEGAAAWQPTGQPAFPPQEESVVRQEYLESGHWLAVVTLRQELYVSSANVCQLLGWHSDTLVQELQARYISFRTLVLRRDDCVGLFHQMASGQVPGVVTGPSCFASELTLFHLDNVNDLLDLFKNTDDLLRAEIIRVLRTFNPARAYGTEGPPSLPAGMGTHLGGKGGPAVLP